MKKLAIFDLDGTYFRWQLYHELVFELKDLGIFSEDTANTLDTALIDWQSHKKSWHDYEMTVIRALEGKLNGLSTSIFEQAAQAVVKRSGHKLYRYTRKLHMDLKAKGYYVLAISGSQQEIAESFSKEYDFDDCIGALYERAAGNFSGTISRRVPGRKHEIIQEYIDKHPDLTLEGSFGVGDSDGDISMLQMVDNPIAFNPSSELLEMARSNGWKIVIERKNIAYTILNGSTNEMIIDDIEKL